LFEIGFQLDFKTLTIPPLATSVTVADIRLAGDCDGWFIVSGVSAGWSGGSQSQKGSDNKLSNAK
jgi:hypothetical protein